MQNKKMDIEQTLRELAAEHLGITPSGIEPASRFVEDLGCDSLDIVELLMAAEEAFDIDIHDQEAEQCATFAQAVALITRKTAK